MRCLCRDLSTVFLFCLFALLALSCQFERTGLSPGDFAPKFTLEDLDGNQRKLSDFRGKVVLLNFWATWCVPCLQEMPELERVYRVLKDQGVVVLAVGVQDTLENLRSFRDKNNITFPILHDSAALVKTRYDVRGFPESFVIDRAGKMVMFQDPETDMPVVKLIGPKRWDSPKVIERLTKAAGTSGN